MGKLFGISGRIISKRFGGVSLTALLFFVGCSRGPERIEPFNAAEQTDCIIQYFRDQLEDSFTIPHPSLFTVTIARDSVSEIKKRVWAIWRKVNEADLLNSGFLQGDATVSWDLPGNQAMPVRFLVKGNMPAGGYPMIINLHGGGQYEVDGPHSAVVNTISWESMVTSCREQEDAPVFYVIPRMSDDRIGSWSQSPQRYAIRKMCRLAALSGKVNLNKIYLSGTSQGGYGTIRLSAFMPDYFGAVSIVAAADAPDEKLENYRNLPLRMDVGRLDSDFSRNIYAMMWKDRLDVLSATAAPGEFNTLVNIQQGKRHAVDIAGISKWMMQYERNCMPARINYLYACCGDGFPLGVYNLNFSAWKTDQRCRILIEETIQKDEIRIHIKALSGSGQERLVVYVPDSMLAYGTVKLIINDEKVVKKNVLPNLGVMVESIALFGDSERIFADKIEIDL